MPSLPLFRIKDGCHRRRARKRRWIDKMKMKDKKKKGVKEDDNRKKKKAKKVRRKISSARAS